MIRTLSVRNHVCRGAPTPALTTGLERVAASRELFSDIQLCAFVSTYFGLIPIDVHGMAVIVVQHYTHVHRS